jgi:microcystin-dependent protein
MSTLRISNIEAKADISNPIINEKVKITNSSGKVLAQVDGSNAGITTVGINTTSTSFTVDNNQNFQFVGGIKVNNINPPVGVSTVTFGSDISATKVTDSFGGFLTNPPGTLIFHCGSTAPSGFLKANGAAISRTTYAGLFAGIGTVFGNGDGSTTFGIPDLRGEFPRGWDDGRSVDSGRAFGSAQTDALQGHYHEVKNSAGQQGTRSAGGVVGGFSNTGAAAPSGTDFFVARALITDGTNGTPSTASETRPRSVALLACIKY